MMRSVGLVVALLFVQPLFAQTPVPPTAEKKKRRKPKPGAPIDMPEETLESPAPPPPPPVEPPPAPPPEPEPAPEAAPAPKVSKVRFDFHGFFVGQGLYAHQETAALGSAIAPLPDERAFVEGNIQPALHVL